MQLPRLHSILFTALACALLALPAAADSQARIVRLSDVQGTVQINKNAGLGYENAFVNLPIIQGTQLRTRANGRAEIEFEDGSTLRLSPNTTVEFVALGRSDAGNRISTVNLVEGRAYVNWFGKSEFTLNFSREKVTLEKPAHFRVGKSSKTADIASFKNDLDIVAPSGTVKVSKKKMVAFDVNDNDKATQAKNIAADPYDEWDQQSIEYHDQYAKNNATPFGYGYSDLNYYGGFSNISGYGMLWQPYFAGAGWNPFMDGAWSWYPGMGYLWASAYPWGWMPYYYGNWNFIPGFGWGWEPGGWNSWRGGIHYVGAAAGFHAPVAPLGIVSTVVVGKGGAGVTKTSAMRTVITNGTAGLGIERGSYGNLHRLNTQVAKSGSVELHAAPSFAATSSRAGNFGYGSLQPAPHVSMGHVNAPSSGHASAGHNGH